MLFYQTDKPDIMIPAIKKCMEYLEKNQEKTPGKTEVLDSGIRCTISAYRTMPEDHALWETHRKYVDVHCVLQGQERVRVCSLDTARTGTYHDDRDYLETEGIPMVDMHITAGMVLCLFPNDAHQTRVQVNPGESDSILKAIFKVPVELIYLC